jgi:hypothetical protein
MSGVHGRKNQAKPLILLGAPYGNRTSVPAVKGRKQGLPRSNLLI